MADKFDAGKPPIELVPPEVIVAMAEVLSFGAAKYGPWNWRRQPFVACTRIYGGVQRHLLAWARGEDIDKESGKEHLVHALTGLAMLWTKLHTQPGVDDRWFKQLKPLAKAIAGRLGQKEPHEATTTEKHKARRPKAGQRPRASDKGRVGRPGRSPRHARGGH